MATDEIAGKYPIVNGYVVKVVDFRKLEQKERDLVLAAELGKVLLDKNEELSRQNERIAEEFSFKLEVRRPNKAHPKIPIRDSCLRDS